MGISKNIKMAMLDKNIKHSEIAEEINIHVQSLYNQLSRDTFTIKKAEAVADALNCDIVLQDRETKKIY